MYAPRTDGWARALTAVPERLRARVEANIAAHGLAYPWWVAIVSTLGQVLCVVVGLALRDRLWPPDLLAVTIVLVAWPSVTQLVLGRLLPWWLELGSIGAAAVWLLSDPVSGSSTIDTAPALLALLTAEFVAREGVRLGAVIGLFSMTAIVVVARTTSLTGGPVHLLDVVLGFVIGGMLRAQMRALTAERAARVGERERATLAERERIAREIHDLVAHSLSVTLLHITGARHALRDADDAAGFDVDDVDDCPRRRGAGRPAGDGRHPADGEHADRRSLADPGPAGRRRHLRPRGADGAGRARRRVRRGR